MEIYVRQRYVYIGSKQFNIIREEGDMLLLERAFGEDAGHRTWRNISEVSFPGPLKLESVVKISKS